MDVFEFFSAEHDLTERKLRNLAENYFNWTREQVFDGIKEACDHIRGHLDKEEELLLEKLQGKGTTTRHLEELAHDKQSLLGEIENLVMVHVDEPGYDEYLKSLHSRFVEHVQRCRRAFDHIKKHADKKQLDEINEELNELIVHSVGYNYIQPQEHQSHPRTYPPHP